MNTTCINIDNPIDEVSPHIEYVTRAGGSVKVAAEGSSEKHVITLPAKTGTAALTEDVAKALKTHVPTLSVGCVRQPAYTNNGDGSFRVAAESYNLCSNASGEGSINTYHIPSTLFVLEDGDDNYIVADYNNGKPILRATLDVNEINETTIAPVYTVYRDGTKLHIRGWDGAGTGLLNKIHRSLIEVQRFRHAAGLDLGEGTNRTVTISAGKVYCGAVPLSPPAFTSLMHDLFLLTCSDLGWKQTQVSSYENNKYNTPQGAKELSAGRYAVNFVYRSLDDGQPTSYILLGSGDYTINEVQLAVPPANLPDLLKYHAIEVGRIIVAKGATSATQIDSALVSGYTPRVVKQGLTTVESLRVNSTASASDSFPAVSVAGGIKADRDIIAGSVAAPQIKVTAPTGIGGITLQSPDISTNFNLRLPPKEGTVALIEDISAAGGGTVMSVGMKAPAVGLTITGGPITSVGTFEVALANDLKALEELSGSGFARRTGNDAWALRSGSDVLADIGGQPAGNYITNNDPRLVDSRNPTKHKASHEAGGTDELDWSGIHGFGSSDIKPAASASNKGYLFYDTTLEMLQRSNGMEWQNIAGGDSRKVGEITTALQAPSDKWLPCDGSLVDPAQYPGLKNNSFLEPILGEYNTYVGSNITSTNGLVFDGKVVWQRINATTVCTWDFQNSIGGAAPVVSDGNGGSSAYTVVAPTELDDGFYVCVQGEFMGPAGVAGVAIYKTSNGITWGFEGRVAMSYTNNVALFKNASGMLCMLQGNKLYTRDNLGAWTPRTITNSIVTEPVGVIFFNNTYYVAGKGTGSNLSLGTMDSTMTTVVGAAGCQNVGSNMPDYKTMWPRFVINTDGSALNIGLHNNALSPLNGFSVTSAGACALLLAADVPYMTLHMSDRKVHLRRESGGKLQASTNLATWVNTNLSYGVNGAHCGIWCGGMQYIVSAGGNQYSPVLSVSSDLTTVTLGTAVVFTSLGNPTPRRLGDSPTAFVQSSSPARYSNDCGRTWYINTSFAIGAEYYGLHFDRHWYKDAAGKLARLNSDNTVTTIDAPAGSCYGRVGKYLVFSSAVTSLTLVDVTSAAIQTHPVTISVPTGATNIRVSSACVYSMAKAPDASAMYEYFLWSDPKASNTPVKYYLLGANRTGAVTTVGPMLNNTPQYSITTGAGTTLLPADTTASSYNETYAVSASTSQIQFWTSTYMNPPRRNSSGQAGVIVPPGGDVYYAGNGYGRITGYYLPTIPGAFMKVSV